MGQIPMPFFIVFFGPFPLELLLETVQSTTSENLILKDVSLVSVVSSLFVIYYLSCVFCSKLLPKSAVQYLLMGVLLMMSKNPGRNSTLGYIGMRTSWLRAKNSCLLVRLIPGLESSAQCTWFSCSVHEGGFSGSLIRHSETFGQIKWGWHFCFLRLKANYHQGE